VKPSKKDLKYLENHFGNVRVERRQTLSDCKGKTLSHTWASKDRVWVTCTTATSMSGHVSRVKRIRSAEDLERVIDDLYTDDLMEWIKENIPRPMSVEHHDHMIVVKSMGDFLHFQYEDAVIMYSCEDSWTYTGRDSFHQWMEERRQ